MKCVKAVVVVWLAFCFSAAAYAGGEVDGATVANLTINTQDGNMVFVTVSTQKSGNPPCSSGSPQSFVLPLTTALQNQFLALLLSARASQSPVQLIGSGLCDTVSGFETLVFVSY
jgi:hypothetical protein